MKLSLLDHCFIIINGCVNYLEILTENRFWFLGGGGGRQDSAFLTSLKVMQQLLVLRPH